MTTTYLSPYDTLHTSLILAQPRYASLLITPLIVGWALNIFLFGSFHTCFLQYVTGTNSSYASDKRWVKVVFWSVLALGYLNAGVNLEELWRYSVVVDRSFFGLLTGGLAFNFQPLLGGTIAAIVQSFLIHRSGQLFDTKRNRYVFYGFMSVVVVAGLVGSVLVSIVGILCYINSSDLSYYPPITYNLAGSIKLWSHSICDLLITLSLYLLLQQYKLQKFNKATDGMINSLVRLSLRTAAYTTVFAFAGAVTASIFSNKIWASSIQCAFSTPLATLYSLSLFTTLNSRQAISEKIKVDGFIPHSGWVFGVELRKKFSKGMGKGEEEV